MAAADPHEVSHQRLEDADRAVMSPSANALTPRQSSIAAAARRQLAVGQPRFSICANLVLPAVAAGRGRDERVVDVGEMRTGLREEFFAVGGDYPANAIPDRSLPASESRHSSEAPSVRTLSGG